MSKSEAMEIKTQEGDLKARYCYDCGEREMEDGPEYSPYDIVRWVEAIDRDRDWTCDRCGMRIKREVEQVGKYSSDPFNRMGQVIAEKNSVSLAWLLEEE